MSEASANLVYACDQWEIDLGRRELRARGLPVPLGGRAFEVVTVLVQSASEFVTKDHLMERVWPGATVGEGTIHVHISAVRKALGPDFTSLAGNTVGHRSRRNGSSKLLIVLATPYTSASPISKWPPHFSREADLARPSNIWNAFFDLPPRRGIPETRFITIRTTMRRTGRHWLRRSGCRVSRNRRSTRLAFA